MPNIPLKLVTLLPSQRDHFNSGPSSFALSWSHFFFKKLVAPQFSTSNGLDQHSNPLSTATISPDDRRIYEGIKIRLETVALSKKSPTPQINGYYGPLIAAHVSRACRGHVVVLVADSCHVSMWATFLFANVKFRRSLRLGWENFDWRRIIRFLKE